MPETARVESDWHAFLRGQGLVREGEHSGLAARKIPEAPAVAALRHLSALSVTGEDAEPFLDGQLSAAIRELPPAEAVLTAWHDPKGRARTLIHVWRSEDGFRLLMPRTLLATIVPKLTMYVLRSRVSIVDHGEEWPVLGLVSAHSAASGDWQHLSGADRFHFFAGPEVDARACWASALAEGHQALGSQEWRWLEMQAGIPGLPAGGSELFLPQFLDLPRFGGLNFRKGCYIGQEVIARTHYLGKVKQGLHLASAAMEALPGSAVRNEQKQKIGHVLDAVPNPTESGQWLTQLVVRGDQAVGRLYADQDGMPELRLIQQEEQQQ